MNKRLIVAIVGMVLFLSIFVIAPLSRDRQEESTPKEYELAVARGIDEYTYQDNSTEDKFWRCLISQSDFDLPCSPRFQTYITKCALWNETVGLNTGEIISVTHESEDLTFPDIYNESQIVGQLMECLTMGRFNLTDSEMQTELGNWEDLFMTTLFIVEERREIEREFNRTLVREGTVTRSKR